MVYQWIDTNFYCYNADSVWKQLVYVVLMMNRQMNG